MKSTEISSWRAVAFALMVFGATSAHAEGEPTAGINLETSPFAAPKPGQSQEAPADMTPRGLTLGELDWAPIASRCAFVRADASGKAAGDEVPEPGKAEEPSDGYSHFVFVTMLADTSGNGQPLERGYVMANGLVRELEKGKTSTGKENTVVTNWRAAGEPRISVGLILTGTYKLNDHTEYAGKMTVFWGDKKEDVAVRGRCQ